VKPQSRQIVRNFSDFSAIFADTCQTTETTRLEGNSSESKSESLTADFPVETDDHPRGVRGATKLQERSSPITWGYEWTAGFPDCFARR
ncbi:hypothetical protein K0M31_018680, partial [Melipona bicolor]